MTIRHPRELGAFLALGLVALLLAACSDATEVSAVQVTGGAVAGVEEDGVRAWRGIPYAAPPVDDLRWQPPQPVESWDGERDGGDYGSPCVQFGDLEARSSEDCLHLNVARPATDEAMLPVMVWLHGGGFLSGSGSLPVYNSPDLVERGVIVITLDYRLGRLGFFAHPSLGGDVGNFGLLDQVAALEWVQDNIARFGGDPDNVTIAGQSAGAMSVNALMSSPATEGLFKRAIAQSGLGWEEPMELSTAAAQGDELFPGLDADELRNLDTEDVLNPQVDLYAGEAPLADSVLPRSVSDTFAAGEQAEVPYLVGTTDLEFNDPLFELSGRSAADIRAAAVGSRESAFEAAYGSREEAARHIVSDLIFSAPARLLAQEHTAVAPTYRYRFEIADPQVIEAGGGAFHGADLPFVFDDVGEFGPAVGELADQVADYWVDFLRDGDPNGEGRPTWPATDTGQILTFTNAGPVAGADSWQARLDLYDESAGILAGQS